MIPRSYFEELTTDLLDRVCRAVHRSMRASGLDADRMDRVLLVGGATRMPSVRGLLAELLGPRTKVSPSPEQAVACGAALCAGRRLAQRRKEEPKFRLDEIAPYSLGLVGTNRDTGRQINKVLISRNTRLPASVKCTLKTQKAGQESLALQFVRGDNQSLDDCQSIGKWVLKSLPADLPAGSTVTATVRFGEDGRISVLADAPEQGIRATRIITQDSGMTRDELDHWRDWVEKTYARGFG
jgi:molecular chaperone HscA